MVTRSPSPARIALAALAILAGTATAAAETHPALDASNPVPITSDAPKAYSPGIALAAPVLQSMGGMVATRFALMYPQRTTKLALVNPIGLEDWQQVVPYPGIDSWQASVTFRRGKPGTRTSLPSRPLLVAPSPAKAAL